MDGNALLTALTPVAERLLERHLSTAKEWFPHEHVPWSQGRDFVPGEEWDAGRAQLDPAVRSALFVNLLTEDNLPYYTNTITRLFGADTVWGTWVRRWTAEEGRHSIVLRDYLTVTRAIDPVVLERARMAQVECGKVPEPDLVHDGMVYVALQELATRIAHHNTGKLCRDAAAYDVMKRIASDENRHHLFYRDLTLAAIELDPSAMVCAIERQVRQFEMPGTGIIDFDQHARAIARAGIYDLSVHHQQILVPVVLRHWDIAGLGGLDAEGEAARASLIDRIERIGVIGNRIASRRGESGALAMSA
jgi:acyl-[acyl-carrier-protein] desaturase